VGKWETRSVFQGGFIAVFSTAAAGGELRRGAIGQRQTQAVMVVVAAPEMQLPPSVGQSKEDLHVQALVAQLAVEAFDIPVLDRLAREDEVEVNAVLVSPEVR
jgi:hypothetical protein